MCKQNHHKIHEQSNMNLRFMSWNVRGIMSSAGSLSYALNKEHIDVAFISEHKLFEHSKSFMGSIEPLYDHITQCDDDFSTYNNIKCGKGGVSILYRKTLNFNIRAMDEIADPRIVGVEITCQSETKIFAFSIYLPSANYPNEIYEDYINTLQAICESYSDVGLVILLGDMNGEVQMDLTTKISFRDKTLSKFVHSNNLTPLTLSTLRQGPNFTYITEEKMIDHVFVFDKDKSLIHSIEILQDDVFCVSDHLPILTTINIPIDIVTVPQNTNKISWNKVSNMHIKSYQNEIDEHLTRVNINCTDIDELYNDMTNAIHNAANNTLPKAKYNSHTKPYWTSKVKAAHSAQRIARRIWINEGRPRGMEHASYANYKMHKRSFRKT